MLNQQAKQIIDQVLEYPAFVYPTDYGNRYSTTFTYELLNDKDLMLFSNKTAQRTVKEKRAKQMAKDYFNILTRENGENYEIPFQSSMVLNLSLKSHGLTEEDIFQNGRLRIPVIKHILSVRDGGHRMQMSKYLIDMFDERITESKSKSRKLFYQQTKQRFLDLSFTVDIYIDLEGNYSKRCLLDLGKSEPVSPGREFYFIHNAYAQAIEYLADDENRFISLNLDSGKYSKYDGLSVPLHYVQGIISKIGKSLLDQKRHNPNITDETITRYLISFIGEILSSMLVGTFEVKNSTRQEPYQYLPECKVAYFGAIKKLVHKEIRESLDYAIKKVVGADVLYSKLASAPKKLVDMIFANEIDLIAKFDAVKELIISEEFKRDVLSSSSED